MMITLPAEILQHIFILLRQEDQMECMLTCRFWRNLIDDSCLFRTLHVYSYAFLEKISKKIQEQPRLGNNVHQLILHLFDINEEEVFKLLEKMPNVRNFRTYGPTFRYGATFSSLMLPWYKHIESIEEETAGSIALYLLSNHVCPNLTDLRLYSRSNDIIPLLKNAPTLEALLLGGMNINFDDIDELHDNIPNLKTLRFKSCTIYGGRVGGIVEGVFVIKVKPANSVTKLSFSGISTPSIDMEVHLLQFITIKYPNLVELVYGTYYSPGSRRRRDVVYDEGWYPLLQALGSQLKKLYIDYNCQFLNFLQILDENKYQIQDMNVQCFFGYPFSNFVHSQQVQYIRNLVLSRFHSHSFDWLKNLKALETLDIMSVRCRKNFRLDFNDLANNFSPTLKSIALHNYIIDAEITSARQYNVTDLAFVDCKLSEKAIRFFDRHFPLLTNLKVKDCEDLPKTLILRSAVLESFCFIDTYKDGPNYVLVRSICDGEERLYFIEEKQQRDHSTISSYRELNPSDFPPVKSRPADNLTVKPDITLCCFTVKKVRVCR